MVRCEICGSECGDETIFFMHGQPLGASIKKYACAKCTDKVLKRFNLFLNNEFDEAERALLNELKDGKEL